MQHVAIREIEIKKPFSQFFWLTKMHSKTQKLLDTAVEILTAMNPMTVRQTFYQLISRQSHKK